MNATAVQQSFTIAEVAAKTGVSAHTLRYYERIGLLDVGRQANGHRRFTEFDIHGVVFIVRGLRRCRSEKSSATSTDRLRSSAAADIDRYRKEASS